MSSVPEGDTVWLAAKRLNEALAGRTLRRFELRVPRFATADLTGRTVTGVAARGKHLLARVGGGVTLHSHLRMDGEWRIRRAAAGAGAGAGAGARAGPGRPDRRAGRPEHEIRAVLANDEWAAVGYRVHDLVLVETAREDTLVGHLGPDLLGPDWDPAEAVRRLAAQPDRPVGEALLDQRNLAGVGNMYKAEVLFAHRLNPWAPVAAAPDLRALVDTAHRLLYANRDHPAQSTTGSQRRGEQHWVYERAGRPCRRCGSRVQVADQGAAPYARVTFWCPACQPSPDPG
jgi:endonuclease-8